MASARADKRRRGGILPFSGLFWDVSLLHESPKAKIAAVRRFPAQARKLTM